MNQHIVKILLAAVLVAPAAAWAAKSPGKPGAPVHFEYSFLGAPKAGQTLAVEVKVTPTAAVDALDLELAASPDLAMEKGGGRHQLVKPQPGAAQRFVIEVRPKVNGVHDLTVRVVTQVDGRRRMSALGIAIPVGPNAERRKTAVGTLVKDGDRAVVVLPAETTQRDR